MDKTKSKSDNVTPYPATHYDEQIRRTIPYYDSFHQETINLIKAAGIKPKVWLDTGCGTGSLVEKASKLFPETRFILADPSAEMLSQAKSKLTSSGCDKAIFLEPCGTNVIRIAPRDRLDVITAIQSHHYMSRDERANATKACYDILSPGGIYVTFENIRPLTKKGAEIGKQYWKNFQVSKGKEIAAAEEHLKRFDSEYFPITAEEHVALLRKTGFETVEILWYSYMQAGFYAIKAR